MLNHPPASHLLSQAVLYVLKLRCGRLKGLLAFPRNWIPRRPLQWPRGAYADHHWRNGFLVTRIAKKTVQPAGCTSLRLYVVFSYSLYFKNLSLYIPPANTPGSHFLPCFRLPSGQLRGIETFGLYLPNAHTSRWFNFLAISRTSNVLITVRIHTESYNVE